MLTFYEWLSHLKLLRLLDETYYGFDRAQYNQLFDEELREGHCQDIRPRTPSSS